MPISYECRRGDCAYCEEDCDHDCHQPEPTKERYGPSSDGDGPED